MSCAGSDEHATEAPSWRISGASTWTAADMRFDFGQDANLRRRSITMSAEYRIAADWTVTAGIGVSLEGDLTVRGERFEIDPGPVGVIGGAYRVLDGDGWEPFLFFGTSLSLSTAKTDNPLTGQDARLTATDARFSLTAGEVFGDVMGPYLTVRAFGGPAFWEYAGADTQGADNDHYQVGLGMIASAGWVDAFFEVVPLGERTAAIGAALSF